MGLYLGPRGEGVPVQRRSQIYIAPSRDEVVKMSDVSKWKGRGGTCIVRLEDYFFKRGFMIPHKRSNTFSSHNIENLTCLIS